MDAEGTAYLFKSAFVWTSTATICDVKCYRLQYSITVSCFRVGGDIDSNQSFYAK